MNRRSFLLGLAAGLAPAVIRTPGLLMPVRALVVTQRWFVLAIGSVAPGFGEVLLPSILFRRGENVFDELVRVRMANTGAHPVQYTLSATEGGDIRLDTKGDGSALHSVADIARIGHGSTQVIRECGLGKFYRQVYHSIEHREVTVV